jgi:hypothetical protein
VLAKVYRAEMKRLLERNDGRNDGLCFRNQTISCILFYWWRYRTAGTREPRTRPTFCSGLNPIQTCKIRSLFSNR